MGFMERQQVINCPEDFKDLGKTWKIFLAGPIQGAPDWQHNMPELEGITWISPRRVSYDGFEYQEQVEWETLALRISDIVLFYIPEPIENIEGRSYAQTTRTEFGEILGRGKKVFCYCYSSFPGKRYFKKKLEEYGQTWCNSFEECINKIKEYINTRTHQILFTSDTHFGSQRTLDLSLRPYRDITSMDISLIEKWNNKVHPGDVVYHLGDYGTTWPSHYLNGCIKYIKGNYEDSGKTLSPGVMVDDLFLDLGESRKYILSHEPSKGLKLREKYGDYPILFGHIHGRQKLKPWRGIDVGVDANNYEPISEDEVNFFLNAIEKGYYDNEVWN